MKILIITEQYFPFGSAMASRIRSFCSMFYKLGHDVYVISSYTTAEYSMQGISYEVIFNRNKKSIDTFIPNPKFKDSIKRYISSNIVDVIFCASVQVNFKWLLKLCKSSNIPLILEQCEWYDVSSYKFGKIDPRYIRLNANFKFYYPKANYVIAISRLLESYYKSQGTKVERIPSIIDTKERSFSNNTNNNDKIKIVFTGNASKSKELILPIVEAISTKDEYLKKIQFDIYGMDKKTFDGRINNAVLNEKTKNNVYVHGFVEQNKIEDILLNSDYQIFIRPNRKSSNAGFPTKLCESFSVGTPVITNDTGDIFMYLVDGDNGFLCEGIEKENVCKVFDKILNISKEDYSRMRNNARITAEKSFDFRNYLNKIEVVLNECKKSYE